VDIKSKLKEQDFKFKHSLGQNFITDTNLLEAIVSDARVESKDNVLGIGVGAGTLTKQICQKAKKVVGVEIDKSLEPIINDNLKDNKNFELKLGDILKYRPDEIKDFFDGQRFKVVANLPYYISTPIIFYLIENDFNLESLTIMLQLEVAERLAGKIGTKDYGAITVLLNAIGDVSITRKVSKTMFVPQPKVDSAVVRFDVNKNKYDVDFKNLSTVVKASFAMRRKTLCNNIMKGFSLSREVVETMLENLGIDITIRAENLGTQQFVALCGEIVKLKS